MELLTEKSKEHFEKWLKKQRFSRYNTYTKKIIIQGQEYSGLNESFVHALIIEWFDSVKIIIEIQYGVISESWIAIIGRKCIESFLPTRSEAIKKGIQRANEIYNDTH